MEFEEGKIYTFSAQVEQTKFDYRINRKSTLLINLHTVDGLVRDHAWVGIQTRFDSFLKPKTHITFTARVKYYVDIDTGKRTKLGLHHVRNIRKGKLDD